MREELERPASYQSKKTLQCWRSMNGKVMIIRLWVGTREISLWIKK